METCQNSFMFMMTKIEDKIAGSGRLAYYLQVLDEWQWCYFDGKVLVETKLR